MTEPEDDDEFVAQQFDAVYEQTLRFIECPCHYHAYCLGVGTMCVPGFSYSYVLHAMIDEVAGQIADGGYTPPHGRSPLVLNDLLDHNDPAGHDGEQIR